MPILHLSIPVDDLPSALAFYVDVLGCTPGRRRETWADVWFHGLQLTLQERPDAHHFGAALDAAAFDDLVARLDAAGVVVDPAGTSDDQRKAKFRDPSGNVVEIKTYRDVDATLGPPPGARRGERR